MEARCDQVSPLGWVRLTRTPRIGTRKRAAIATDSQVNSPPRRAPRASEVTPGAISIRGVKGLGEPSGEVGGESLLTVTGVRSCQAAGAAGKYSVFAFVALRVPPMVPDGSDMIGED